MTRSRDPQTRGLDSERLADAALLPFLPMLYVAWADGDLSDREMSEIRQRVSDAEAVDDDCRAVLGNWLDPSRPPSASDLAALLTTIRTGAAGLGTADKSGLAELGVELAQREGHEVSPAERKALEVLEDALAVAGSEASRRILTAARPEPEPAEAEPTFDVAAMTAIFDGRYAELRNDLRALLSEADFRYREGLYTRVYRAQVLTWCRALAERGYGALGFPEEYGGGGDPGAFMAAFEVLATHDLSLMTKFGVQFGLFGGSIHQLGTAKHHGLYLAKAGSLELPGGFAMTETGHGSNVHDIETTARFDPATDEFVIHTPNDGARKDYIGNAAVDGRLMTVFAQLETGGDWHGVHAFLVPIRTAEGETWPGVEIEDCGEKLGLNGVDNGRLRFDQVRVPRDNLLDRFATVDADGAYSSPIASPSRRFFTMLGTLVGGRVSVARAGAATAQSALTIAVRYALRRRQFGPAGEPETVLMDYLSHQLRLLPRLATSYALHFALDHLTERYLAGGDAERREVEAMAAGLKAFSTWHATDTIQACREACGGQGYLAENRFAALKADSDVFTTFEGDNTVLLQLLAKSLLSGYKQQFGDMSLLALARFLAGQAAIAVAELNPVITRRTDEEHLRDPEFQLAAFTWRADHLLASVARRLRRRIGSGMDSHEALIQCQDHLLATAKAEVERLVMERFQTAIESSADRQLAPVLATVRDLFALSRLYQDRGWFLSQGYFEPPKAKAVRNLVNQLCGELRPHALALVDAFGIPDALLAAPIATGPTAADTNGGGGDPDAN